MRPLAGLSVPLIALAAALAGCSDDGSGSSGFDPTADGRSESERLAAYCGDDWEAVESRIDGLLGVLTLEQKTELMAGRSLLPADGIWAVDGVPEYAIPGFRMLDGPRGLSAFSGLEATAFPVGMARGATWDPELERRVGRAMGDEHTAATANVILAPTINILRHPLWGRAQETYGEDPLHMGDMGVAFIEGVQERGVIASAKHYAANSIEDTRLRVNVSVDERSLREIYLPHFRRAVQEAHVGSVMSAYNRVNGLFMSENAPLLNGVLKEEWGFAGFVESDFFFGVHSSGFAALSGLDVEMPFGIFYGAPLAEAVRSGALDESVIDGAVRRGLRAQLCFRLDETPLRVDRGRLATAEHVALAREVARRAAVLLRNEGGTLPFDPAALSSRAPLVVAGPLADVENIGDEGSSDVIPPYVVTVLEGLEERLGAARVVDLSARAIGEAEAATIRDAGGVVLVAGLTSAQEGESIIAAGDRAMLALPEGQVTLIRRVAELNPRTAVVLMGGSAITMEGWLERVGAVMMVWYPGLEGGHAIAELLVGDAEPTGRLPISFPVRDADLPVFDNVSLEVSYDADYGYRRLTRTGTPALFPFGFGLAYTTVEYLGARLAGDELRRDDELRVAVDVANSGARPTVETVQLYVSVEGSAVERAPRELRAFARVALAPGETRTVELALPVRDLAYWDVGAGAWVVEPTAYVAHVGPDVERTPLALPFRVVGG